jgi:hypothetical protein
LINALPGNSSVNTVHHAKTEEAVFSVGPTDAPIDRLDSDHVMCVYRGSLSLRSYIGNSDRIGSGKLEEYSKQAVSLRSTEEYKKSACEDLTRYLKIL